MEFDEFLREALPPLGYAWRPHRRRGLRRKIMDRARKLHCAALEDYLYFLRESREEQAHLETLLPITVSRFFRNHSYYDFLRERIFPDLLQQSIPSLNIWSIGAAAGEEPYSIAMVWDYWFAKQYPATIIKICATDIDDAIMERGRTGLYQKSSLKEVPAPLLERYFEPIDSQFRLSPRIKQYVEWHKHNIRNDPPPRDNHLIFCCYLAFTYFSKAVQQAIIKQLAQALVPGGTLVLGKKDSFPQVGFEYFEKLDPRLNVFRRFR